MGFQHPGNFLLVSVFLIEKTFDLVQSIHIAYELCIKCQRDYWFLTWVKNISPEKCGLVVPIVVSHVHQKRNHRCLLHREFKYLFISPLRLRF